MKHEDVGNSTISKASFKTEELLVRREIRPAQHQPAAHVLRFVVLDRRLNPKQVVLLESFFTIAQHAELGRRQIRAGIDA